MNQPRRRLTWFGVLLTASGLACSSGSPSTTGSGRSPSSSGGATSSGGVGGSGGATASGGTLGSGGVSNGSGGTTSTGGVGGSGATTASGGTPGSGGISATGGATGGAGGTVPSGGDNGGGGDHGGVAGGNGGSAGSAGAGGHAIPSTITLTSPVLMEGGTFAPSNTCADPGMGSPELDWTAGPSGTLSYAITFTDLTDGNIYWAIWNIPVPSGAPTKITLPAKLDTIAMLTTPTGAIQINRVNGRGYYGPCLAGETHTYQFQVYAIPTASLAGMPNSTDAASASIRAVATATGTLTATSNAHH